MRLLALDRGNTNLDAALFENGGITATVKLAPEKFDELERTVSEFDVKQVVFSSVVPTWSDQAREFFDYMGIKYLEVGAGINLPFKLLVKNPESLGPDRISLAAGARKLGYESAVIVDAGTAVTVDLLTENGFEGGTIFPGMGLLIQALREGTARLKDINTVGDIIIPPGKDTQEAVSAGVFWGLVGAVNSLIRKTVGGRTEGTGIILTGGYAGKITRFIEYEHIYVEDLIFQGLYDLFLLNE